MEDLKYLIDTYGIEITIIILAVVGAFYLVKIIFGNYLSNRNQKKIIAYENAIHRSTMAYKILVEKELGFYERYFEISSNLVTDIQDVEYNFLNNDIKKLREHIIKVLEIIPNLKKETLVYEPYYDSKVGDALLSLIILLQNDFALNAEKMLTKKIKKEKVKKICDDITKNLALISFLISSREKDMSN